MNSTIPPDGHRHLATKHGLSEEPRAWQIDLYKSFRSTYFVHRLDIFDRVRDLACVSHRDASDLQHDIVYLQAGFLRGLPVKHLACQRQVCLEGFQRSARRQADGQPNCTWLMRIPCVMSFALLR